MNTKDQELLKTLRKKQMEVTNLPTQQLGMFTPYYKRVASYLKIRPWRMIILIAIILVVLFRLFFGASFVKLATLLQAGF